MADLKGKARAVVDSSVAGFWLVRDPISVELVKRPKVNDPIMS